MVVRRGCFLRLSRGGVGGEFAYDALGLGFLV